MSYTAKNLLLWSLLFVATAPSSVAGAVNFLAAFTLASPTVRPRIVVAPDEAECVLLAAHDLALDVRKIADVELEIVRAPVPSAGDVFIKTVGGMWESYSVEEADGVLSFRGADSRGTMFAVYEFAERFLGVDPMYFWSGVPHPRRKELAWKRVSLRRGSPSVRFRGWFLNDEDLLTEWQKPSGRRDYLDYRYYRDVMSLSTAEAVAEALVRCRFNMVIPGSFINIANPPEKALLDVYARRGLFLTMHHIEPMGTSGYAFKDYWKRRGRDLDYSYHSHPQEVEEVWREQARAWMRYPNVIWQLGLRGSDDKPMWANDPSVPKDDAGRAEIISRAMARQVAILDELGVPKKDRFISVTLWAEGAYFNQRGLLKIPEGAIVVFSDNSPGWRWQQDFRETPRDLRHHAYGVYYHHQLYSCGPHVVPLVPVARTHAMLREAAAKSSATYAIFNAGNVREFVCGLAAAGRMSWNLREFSPKAWTSEWVACRLPKQAKAWEGLHSDYYAAIGTHPSSGLPMFMDGQLRKRILESLARLRQGGAAPAPAKKSAAVDPFRQALADTNPRLDDPVAELKLLKSQRERYASVVARGEKLLATASETERSFAYNHFVYPALIMCELSTASLRLSSAVDAMEKSDRKKADQETRAAEAAFVRIKNAAERYCSGPWAGWYRGCKKIDFAKMHADIQSTLHWLEGNDV